MRIYLGRVIQGLGFVSFYQVAHLVASKTFWDLKMLDEATDPSMTSGIYLTFFIIILLVNMFWVVPKTIVICAIFYGMHPWVCSSMIDSVVAVAKCKKAKGLHLGTPTFLHVVELAFCSSFDR